MLSLPHSLQNQVLEISDFMRIRSAIPNNVLIIKRDDMGYLQNTYG